MEETVEKNLNFNDRISFGFSILFLYDDFFYNHEMVSWNEYIEMVCSWILDLNVTINDILIQWKLDWRLDLNIAIHKILIEVHVLLHLPF